MTRVFGLNGTTKRWTLLLKTILNTAFSKISLDNQGNKRWKGTRDGGVTAKRVVVRLILAQQMSQCLSLGGIVLKQTHLCSSTSYV